MLIISYRASYSRNTSCHCHPEFEHGASELVLTNVSDNEEAAEFIANHIIREPDHDYVHLIATDFDDFSGLHNSTFFEGQGAESITILGENQHNLLAPDLQLKVREKLDAHAKAEATKKEAARVTAIEQQKAAQRKRDLEDLDRIQKRLREAYGND